MINPTSETWSNWGITEESHKFFVIRWEEIFSFETFNTWQLRSTNFIKLIRELMEVAKIVDFVPESHINIKRIIEEAKKNEDYVIEEFFPFAREYLNKLESIYNSEITNDSIKSTRKFVKVANVLLENLCNYDSKNVEYIKRILSSSEPGKYKLALNSLINSLAVSIADRDYSIRALQDSLNILIDNNISNFVERFYCLINKLNGDCTEFECSFFINWAGHHQKIDHYEIELTLDRPTNYNNDLETTFFEQNKSSLLANIKVSATEEYSAYIKSKQKIEELFGINQLYQPKKEATIRNDKALIRSSNAEYLISDDPLSNYAPTSSNRSDKLINDFLQLFKRLDKKDCDQINSCLQYHKLALRSDSEELRLVNLWISLESLFLGGEESIIKRICEFVPRIDTTGYIYGLLLALSKSIDKLWKDSDTQNILNHLEKSNKYQLKPYDLLKILLSEEDSEVLKLFTEIIKNNPLLIFRIERLWFNVYGYPERLAKSLEEHCERVEWQVQRIYRARNLIMHTGACPRGTRILIQHLHNYLNKTAHSLITDLKKNKSWGLQEALEHRSLLYEHFIKRLKNYKVQKLSIDQIYYWDKSLFDTNQPAWSEQRISDASN